MRKKTLTEEQKEKQVRKSDICYMAMVAGMVNDIVNGVGVCGVNPYLERREPLLHYKPGVMLQPWKFFKLFGKDTDYEYLEESSGDKVLYTEVNGVVFYALITNLDRIMDGRLV